MFRSLSEDLQHAFSYGNMVTRLMIIQSGVFVVTALLSAFLPSFYQADILPWIALPGDFHTFLYRPWTWVTHFFIHGGLWHLIWNMLTLYWFGNITGDLLGDKKILPVFFLGGLAGGLVFLLSSLLLNSPGGFAVGSSAAVLSVLFAAVATAPEYRMHLILIGPVRIKFIGLFILFIDIIGTQSASNAGGHIAHLGGALFGFLFVALLRKGYDLSDWSLPKNFNKQSPVKRRSLKVAHKSSALTQKTNNENSSSVIDQILDKIKLRGYESLTAEEKEILYQASKKE
ncbi:MAG: rhomboid family intramembrane serine protease [Saprospiraceae bacterium]|nr:rhomboid family intramembrane serine protease [Saprospiraceae bacterium]